MGLSTPNLSSELTLLTDQFEDFLNLWVNPTIKYAIIHFVADLPIRDASKHAFIELESILPSNYKPQVLIEKAHNLETHRSKVGFNPLKLKVEDGWHMRDEWETPSFTIQHLG